MRAGQIQPNRIVGALLLLNGATASLGCSSQYEPEGQFWPDLGPVGLGVAAATDAGANALGGGPPGSVPGSSTGAQSDEVAATGTPRLDQNSATGNASASGSTNVGAAAAAGDGNAAGAASGGDKPSGIEPGSAVDGAISETCSLRVSVTTTPPGGKYKPRNVGAIWIGDSSGQFVKSLEVWGNKRLSHVTAWTAATRAEGVAGNKVDAITSATLSAHRTHNVTWNCEDHAGKVVPDDTYRVYFEVTDSNSSGPNHFEVFVKGPMPTTSQSSATNFNGIVLTFTP